jgi:hypothetical protein
MSRSAHIALVATMLSFWLFATMHMNDKNNIIGVFSTLYL